MLVNKLTFFECNFKNYLKNVSTKPLRPEFLVKERRAIFKDFLQYKTRKGLKLN